MKECLKYNADIVDKINNNRPWFSKCHSTTIQQSCKRIFAKAERPPMLFDNDEGNHAALIKR